MSKKIFAEIQKTIVERMENAKASNWVQPWLPSLDVAVNPYSNTVYSGFNQFYLSLSMEVNRFKISKWLTFNQAKNLNATIVKGEKATPIMFYQSFYKNEQGEHLTVEDVKNLIKETGKSLEELKLVKKAFIKFFFVFNVAQIEGLPKEYYNGKVNNNLDFTGCEAAENILVNSKAKFHFIVGNDAFYDVKNDEIVLPERNQFVSVEHFYDTAFHELSHWSGAKHRLNRKVKNPFGSEKYAFEELIAELSSAFICGSINLKKEYSNNAAYLNSWLQAFKNDIQVFFKAAASAQKSADYLLQFVEENRLELVA